MLHGAVDGFSGFVGFLKCSTNNGSETVLWSFVAAVYRCMEYLRSLEQFWGGGGNVDAEIIC